MAGPDPTPPPDAPRPERPDLEALGRLNETAQDCFQVAEGLLVAVAYAQRLEREQGETEEELKVFRATVSELIDQQEELERQVVAALPVLEAALAWRRNALVCDHDCTHTDCALRRAFDAWEADHAD